MKGVLEISDNPRICFNKWANITTSFRCADDSTVGFINWNESAYGWIYQTFKFIDYPEVHIHCDALVCLTSDVDPECDRSCLKTTTTTSTTPSTTAAASGTGGTTASASGGRRRRSVHRERIHLSSPTIIVYDPRQDGSVITRGEGSKFFVKLVIGFLGKVSIFFCVVLTDWLKLSRVMRKPAFAYAKTKTQISNPSIF